jgi:hypothetical protein
LPDGMYVLKPSLQSVVQFVCVAVGTQQTTVPKSCSTSARTVLATVYSSSCGTASPSWWRTGNKQL